jgi:hypothetical protein
MTAQGGKAARRAQGLRRQPARDVGVQPPVELPCGREIQRPFAAVVRRVQDLERKDRLRPVAAGHLDRNRTQSRRAFERAPYRPAEFGHDPHALSPRHHLECPHLGERGMPAQQQPEIHRLGQTQARCCKAAGHSGRLK